MSEITKEKYQEAEEHFVQLQNALFELMSHAYGEEIANLLFNNMFSDKDDEEYCLCDAEFVASMKEKAVQDCEYIRKAMEMLEKMIKEK